MWGEKKILCGPIPNDPRPDTGATTQGLGTTVLNNSNHLFRLIESNLIELIKS